MIERKKTTFEEQLQNKGRIIYTNKGVSMWPLLRQDRDLMVIERKEEGCLKKYDAVLFKRKNGQYVLHRILKIKAEDYLIVGDNCFQKEYVKEEQILGVLKAVVRNGKTILVTNKWYLLYVHIWCDFFPLRALILRVRSWYHVLGHQILKLLGKR